MIKATTAARHGAPQAWHQTRETPAPSLHLNRCQHGVDGIDCTSSASSVTTQQEPSTSAGVFREGCASARLAFLATPR